MTSISSAGGIPAGVAMPSAAVPSAGMPSAGMPSAGMPSVVAQYYIPQDEPVRELGKYEKPALGMTSPYCQTRVRTFQSLISSGNGPRLPTVGAAMTGEMEETRSDQTGRKRSCRICGSPTKSNLRHRSNRKDRQPHTYPYNTNSGKDSTTSATTTGVISKTDPDSSDTDYNENRTDRQDWVLVLGKEINRYSLTERERKDLLRQLKGIKPHPERRRRRRHRSKKSDAHLKSLPLVARPAMPPPMLTAEQPVESTDNRAIVPFQPMSFSPELPTKFAPAEFVSTLPMTIRRMTSQPEKRTTPPPQTQEVLSRSNPLLTQTQQQPAILSRAASISGDAAIQWGETSSHHHSNPYGSTPSSKYFHYYHDLPANKLNPFPNKRLAPAF